MVCNSGVGLTPVQEGRTLDLSAGGLYNGLILLTDDQTRSYWDHITGRAVHGPLKGSMLETWPIEQTLVSRELEQHPATRFYRSRPTLKSRLMDWLLNLKFMKNRLPPGFRRTMGPPDARLAEMAMGLGVVAGGEAVFYPLAAFAPALKDSLAEREMSLKLDENGVPVAVWADASGERPLQIFCRWYGFAYTWPGCRVFGAGDDAPGG